MMRDPKSICWYVLKTAPRQELKVRDELRKRAMECYVPMVYAVETVKGRTLRKLAPAIHGLVFVRGSEELIKQYQREIRNNIYLMTRPTQEGRNELIVVNDTDMERFIHVTEHAKESLTYYHPDEVKLHPGETIVIHGGVFDGVTATVAKVKGKRDKTLVVYIPGVSVVALQVKPDLVELVSHKKPVKKGQRKIDIDEDGKLLYEEAYRLLFNGPDKARHEGEYYVLKSEVKRLYELLKPYRGMTNQAEGELAVALLLGAKVLDDNVDNACQRCEAVAEKLRVTSILRARLLLMSGVLTGNQRLVDELQQTVSSWKKNGLQTNQRAFVEEMDRIIQMS